MKHTYYVINVWNHKTASSMGQAKLVCPPWFYKLLLKFIEGKDEADLVFTTPSGQKITHTSTELDALSALFGKKFNITPIENRKAVASQVADVADCKVHDALC